MEDDGFSSNKQSLNDFLKFMLPYAFLAFLIANIIIFIPFTENLLLDLFLKSIIGVVIYAVLLYISIKKLVGIYKNYQKINGGIIFLLTYFIIDTAFTSVLAGSFMFSVSVLHIIVTLAVVFIVKGGSNKLYPELSG